MLRGSASAPAGAATRLVVLDLDGTVVVGDGPVRAYAQALVPAAGTGASADLIAMLDAYLAGDTAGEGAAAADGYAVVAGWAERAGVAAAVRERAYDASRAAVHAGEVAVDAPPGLAELLGARPPGTACVLVTNAPVDGIEPLLGRIGLIDRFDETIGTAGKPARMGGVLRRLLDRWRLPADRLLSIGDVWANDLAPAAAIGSATAYVDRFGRGDGHPTYRARSLPELYPDIERWWSA